MKKYIVLISLLLTTTCYASESRFTSISAMMEEFSDYNKSDNTFKVISKKPLHIQLSPRVVAGDFPDVIEESIKRTIIYGVYRSFIHTDVNQIRVTALPLELDFKTGNTRPLPGYKRTLAVGRAKAEALVNKYLKIDNLTGLVTTEEIAGMVLKDQWSDEFNRIYYNDQGYPGITKFFGDLSK